MWRELIKHHQQAKPLDVDQAWRDSTTATDDDVAMSIGLLLHVRSPINQLEVHAGQANGRERLTKHCNCFVFETLGWDWRKLDSQLRPVNRDDGEPLLQGRWVLRPVMSGGIFWVHEIVSK
ncbi:hypothetical protein DM819_21570 [Pseudomonas hunanensis]|uniref:Uncharacterized protein n=1 Tax=Pseudomonas hunanensis TaxID=1247546 RepID=A0ABD6NBA5_9PSED|nr:hypothetical protein [Pseudomonas hunanensis]